MRKQSNLDQRLRNAVERNDARLVADLLKDKANIHAIGSDGKSVLQVAKERKQKNIISLLLETSLPYNAYQARVWLDILVDHYQKKLPIQVLKKPIRGLVMAVQLVSEVYGNFPKSMYKFFLQTIDPLYSPGEYDKKIYESLIATASEKKEPNLKEQAKALRFIRRLFERDKNLYDEYYSTEISEVPDQDNTAKFAILSNFMRNVVRTHINQVMHYLSHRDTEMMKRQDFSYENEESKTSLKGYILPFLFGPNKRKSNITVYSEEPQIAQHPLACQLWYYKYLRGGACQKAEKDSFQGFQNLAVATKTSYVEIVTYALNKKNTFEEAIDSFCQENQQQSKLTLLKSDTKDVTPSELSFLKPLSGTLSSTQLYTKLLTYYQNKSYYRAGLIYENGCSVPVDKVRALTYFERGINADIDGRNSFQASKCIEAKDNIEKKIDYLIQGVVGGQLDAFFQFCVDMDTSKEKRTIFSKKQQMYENRVSKNAHILLFLGIVRLIEGEPLKNFVNYFIEATKTESVAAYFYLGLIFERGMAGVTPNLEQAINYYRQAIGHTYAMYRLGIIYLYGSSLCDYVSEQALNGKEKIAINKSLAASYFMKATLQHYAPAQYYLTCRYFHGWGMPVNYTTGKMMAKLALYGGEFDELDNDKVIRLYDYLAMYHKDIENDYQKAMAYYYGGFEKANGNNSFPILNGILRLSRQEVGGLSLNAAIVEAIVNYQVRPPVAKNIKSSEHRMLIGELGFLYYEGRWVKQDLVKATEYLRQAFEWYLKRAGEDSDKEDSYAWYWLGEMAATRLLTEANQPGYYYQKAVSCKPVWFLSHLYYDKAKQRLIPAIQSHSATSKSTGLISEGQKHTKTNEKKWSFNITAFHINSSELTENRLLGSGSFGGVYCGTWGQTKVAIKRFHCQQFSEEALYKFREEARIMMAVRSPHVIQLFGLCETPPYRIVMEYAQKGSLKQLLHSNENLTWTRRYQIAFDMSVGLSHMHQQKILHRDLKSDNVLIMADYRAKLADFGLSKIKSETTSSGATKVQRNNHAGTTPWKAPELFKRGGKRTFASDVYSLGIVFWELASRKRPFSDAEDEHEISVWVREGERDEIPKDCPKEYAAIIRRCWSGGPEERPAATQIASSLSKLFSSSKSQFEESEFSADFKSMSMG